jgi:hypothetical protein
VSRRKSAHSKSTQVEVGRLQKSLEELYLRCDPRDFDDLEVAGDLARYLCVRVSGFLEQATQVILRDYCAKNSWGSVQTFAHSWLDRMPNLSAEALVGLIKRFDAEIAEELHEFLNLEERGTRLNSLIGIRNDVAHGKNQGVSRDQAWGYFEIVDQIIQWLMESFAPIETEKSQ